MREKYAGRSEPIINKPSDIPKGLVAKRKAELLLAKLEESLKLEESINKESESHTKEESSESLKPRLTHPTNDRPKIKHRPPSSFSYTNSDSTLFSSSKDEKNEEELPASMTNDEKKTEDKAPTPIWTALSTALSRAVDYYTKRIMEGTTPSKSYGWFSWLRHGKAGEDKAGELNSEVQETSTVESLLDVLHLFFVDSHTKYENHSLAPYVVDELNKLLVQHALKPFMLKLGAQHDINSWLHIKNQLSQLIWKEEPQEKQTLPAPM